MRFECPEGQLFDHCVSSIWQVILNSMHKFQPRIHIVKANDEKALTMQQGDSDSFSTHIFTETQFMGVTAYQNQQVSMHSSTGTFNQRSDYHFERIY